MRTVKIPEYVTIQNIRIDIKEVAGLDRYLERMGKPSLEPRMGYTDFSEAMIYLEKHMHPSTKMHVLRHEIAHWIGWLVADEESWSEPQVDAMASILGDILRDLPAGRR